jgi:NADPH:quinone reductase-like Zn-dependent oxidoreductase
VVLPDPRLSSPFLTKRACPTVEQSPSKPITGRSSFVRAVVVRSLNGPNQIEVIETPTPTPGRHEALARVAAAPLHPADFQATSGMYVKFGAAAEADQYGVGIDVAGTVEAIGDGVSTVTPGQAVIGLQERLDQRTACQPTTSCSKSGQSLPRRRACR